MYAIANENVFCDVKNLVPQLVQKPRIRKFNKTKTQASVICFITVNVSKDVYEHFHANLNLNLSSPSIILFTKVLQMREFVNVTLDV